MTNPNSSYYTRLVVHRSIHEIEEIHWDSIIDNDNLFHTHRFIKSVEDSNLEDSNFWYLLFYSGNKLVGTTVLSSFYISLDLLTTGLLKKLILQIRKLIPNCFKVRILICGLPISLGQSNLIIKDEIYYHEILNRLSVFMSDISRSEYINFQCVKEFQQNQCSIMDGLKLHNFLRVNSLPYVSLDIRWNSFNDYIDNLRHSYRRKILRSLKKIQCILPEFNSYNSVHLELFKSTKFPSDRFNELYIEVMNRVEIKLETLNEMFFKNIFNNMNEEIEIIALIDKSEVIGCALVSTKKNIMTFLLVGINYSLRNDYDIYFNLVYGIIDLAIKRGCEKLELGQTSYQFKQRIGGTVKPQYFYIKSNSYFYHEILKIFGCILFPKTKMQTFRVYRHDI